MVNPAVPTSPDYLSLIGNYLSLIGLSAIISAGVSTVLNYFLLFGAPFLYRMGYEL
jgi:hypothetical protein